MIHRALVLRFTDQFEEVAIQIGDVRLVCFGEICPYEIFENESYPVEFHLQFFDSFQVEHVPEITIESIVRLNNACSYAITGRLDGRYLKSMGLCFEDDFFASDFAYLSGEMVRVHVDRLDLEFTEE